MKKLLSILLIAIYSTAALGMSVKEFYCCGKLSSVSISFNSESKQSCSKQLKEDGCCKTKCHLLKVKDNHLNVHAAALVAKCFTHSAIHLPVLNAIAYSSPLPDARGIHDPPLLHSSVPIYIFACNFRI